MENFAKIDPRVWSPSHSHTHERIFRSLLVRGYLTHFTLSSNNNIDTEKNRSSKLALVDFFEKGINTLEGDEGAIIGFLIY